MFFFLCFTLPITSLLLFFSLIYTTYLFLFCWEFFSWFTLLDTPSCCFFSLNYTFYHHLFWWEFFIDLHSFPRLILLGGFALIYTANHFLLLGVFPCFTLLTTSSCCFLSMFYAPYHPRLLFFFLVLRFLSPSPVVFFIWFTLLTILSCWGFFLVFHSLSSSPVVFFLELHSLPPPPIVFFPCFALFTTLSCWFFPLSYTTYQPLYDSSSFQ